MLPERHKLAIRHLHSQEERPVVVTVTADETEAYRLWVIAIEDHPEWMARSRRFSRALLDVMTAMEADGWLLLCHSARVEVASFNRTAVQRGGRYGWVRSLTKKFDDRHDEQVLLLGPLGREFTPATRAEKAAFSEKWREFNGIPKV